MTKYIEFVRKYYDYFKIAMPKTAECYIDGNIVEQSLNYALFWATPSGDHIPDSDLHHHIALGLANALVADEFFRVFALFSWEQSATFERAFDRFYQHYRDIRAELKKIAQENS